MEWSDARFLKLKCYVMKNILKRQRYGDKRGDIKKA